MDNDFKDLKEEEYLIEKKHLLVVLISSLLITFIYQFHLKGYFFEAMLPFILVLVSYLIIFKDAKKNKKAYYMMIPLSLIFISDFIVGIDNTNKDLNLLIVPVLLSMMMLLLLNKNYQLKGNILTWIFKLFPRGLFSNLRFLKIKSENENGKKVGSIFAGIGFGLIFAIIIGYLLIQADDYFKVFVGNIFSNIIDFNANYLLIFVLSFILIFSILINLFRSQDDEMKEVKLWHFDKTIVLTCLGIVNSVFVLFLLSEVSRLTSNFLQIPVEYTYSSYAREGFFQLLAVTFINYAIIMFLLYKTNLVKENKTIQVSLVLLIAFSIILIFNSYYRMYLYINHYGFTILRCQVILFLLMELVLFTLMILRIFNHFKKNNAFVYFIIVISFYIVNLYLCSDWLVNILNETFNKIPVI